MSRSSRGITGALALALLAVACDIKVGENTGFSVDFAAGKATDEWVRSYEIAPGGRLEIVNFNGQIRASAASGSRVEVRATREARTRNEDTSREILRNAQLRESVAPDHVTIQAPAVPEGGGFGRARMTVRYDVRVPPGLNLQFKNQNGEVTLEHVNASRIIASSTNGGISGRGVSAAVEAATVNGGIRMELENVTGETRLVTVNGGVLVTLARTVNANLEATVVNGGVVVQDGLPFVADEQSRQRVTGRFNKGGPRVILQTTNGGIRVQSPM